MTRIRETKPSGVPLACIALAGAALASAALAGAATAQPVTDEQGIVVYGRSYPPGEPRELSMPVTYRDLDLSTDTGAQILQERVTAAADTLCKELDQPEERAQNTAVLPSCQAAARGSAAWDVRRAITAARGGPASR